MNQDTSCPRRGMVLILVLVVVALLSLSGLTFSKLMMIEREVVDLTGKQAQSRALAQSGIEATRLFLAMDPELLLEEGGFYDNPDHFQGVLVIDNDQARKRGRYTMVAPLIENGVISGVRYGVENESSRLNLNILLAVDESSAGAGRDLLMGLSGMTEELADSILDWMDEDDEPREFGAELDYYSALEPPYAPRNGPPDTIEELLLVAGMTYPLLFGVDANRNGFADNTEPDASTVDEYADNADGSMNGGWAPYLTLYSVESNLNSEGEAKTNINGDDLEALHGELSQSLGEEAATFIIAYRQNGPYDPNAQNDTQAESQADSQADSQGPAQDGNSGEQGNQQEGSNELDFSAPAQATFNTVLDLIGIQTQVTFEGQDEPTVLDSPYPDDPGMMSDFLATLTDTVTTNDSELIPGRINIDQASRLVLEGLPDITAEVVDTILAERIQDPINADESRTNETWLLGEGLVTLDEMKALMPFVTTGGNTYRSQVVGFFDAEGPIARVEVIFDATTQPASVLFWRDMTHLGPGYTQETLTGYGTDY